MYDNSDNTRLVQATTDSQKGTVAMESLEKEIQQLTRMATHLQNRHFIVAHEHVGMYNAAYLGALLRFFSTNIEMRYIQRLQPATLFQQWMEGQLPVQYNPQIEITVEQMFELLTRAVQIDQLNAFGAEQQQALAMIRSQLDHISPHKLANSAG